MSRSTVLLPLDPGSADHGQIGWAVSLAGRLQARLIGFATSDLRLNVHRGMSPKAAAEGLEHERAATEARLAALGQSFLAQAGEGAEWRGMIGEAEECLSLHARAADLIVLSNSIRHPDPGSAILSSGRPVLVTSGSLRPLDWGKAIVAWKDTREARRAVADALPLLRLFQQVHVVAVIEAEAAAAREGSADVAAWLKAHGVAAEPALVEPQEGSVALALKHAAERAGAELIVSGAYSHGPLRQRVFGGLTSSLLGDTQLHRFLSY